MGEPLWNMTWQFLIKLNVHLPYNLQITLTGIYSDRSENLCLHKHLYMNIHSSFICNGPKLETTQMSFDRWMGEQIIVDPYSEILLSN